MHYHNDIHNSPFQIYGPSLLKEIRLLQGPAVTVRNKRTGFEYAIPSLDDLPWEDVINAPGVELTLNSTAMTGEIWALTNSSDVIVRHRTVYVS